MRDLKLFWPLLLGGAAAWLSSDAGVLLGAASSGRIASSAPPPPPAWGEFVETNFPFFSSVLEARRLGAGWPADNLTPRGLILNLGHDCWACFDTELLRMSALWTGSAVSPVSMSQGSYHSSGLKAPGGQGTLPVIAGAPWLATGPFPGWQLGHTPSNVDPRIPVPDESEIGRGPLDPSLGRFQALRLTEQGLQLEYSVAGVPVRETVQARRMDGQPVVQRQFEIERVPQPLTLILGHRPSAAGGSLSWAISIAPAAQSSNVEFTEADNRLRVVRLRPTAEPVEFRVAMSLGGMARTWEIPHHAAPPSRRWTAAVTTGATLGDSQAATVTDDIALPTSNPWRRNVRLADIAFYPEGRAAGVTFDGDVWMVSGLSGELSQVVWKRFASGLHEPLSVVVRDRQLYVFDRNGIWRLRDTDDNGEADVHELFSNAFTQTAETREFATGMRAAPDGTLVVAKGGQQNTTVGKHNGTVLRVARDGGSVEILGWGLRMPFIGVHPKTGLVTASDQQGHHIPTTPLHLIRDGQYYGFVPEVRPKDPYPAPIADPLMWIPHPINPSGVSQVWLADADMGPMNDALIHLGYYRPELFLVLWNHRASRPQAAVVSLTRDLTFAPLNGAVNPVDRQLYVAGFQIWGTQAPRVSGLARLRYTGLPSLVPSELAPMREGILLRFHQPLDLAEAALPSRYSAERWNYRRTPQYGSPHYRLDGSKGQETMTPSSAYLSRDQRSVFLGIPDMKPIMQMRLGWAIATQAGASLSGNAYFTPYELVPFDPEAEGFEKVLVDLTPRETQTIASATPITPEEGQRIAELMGCVACHSSDGSTLGKVGPTWRELFGRERTFVDGARARADEEYLRESMMEPTARVVSGFDTSDTGMPSYEGVITDAQMEALIAYIKSLSDPAP